MIAYMCGIAMPLALLCVIALATDGAARIDNPWVYSFVCAVFVVPVAGAWAAAELTQIWRKSPLLVRGARRRFTRFAFGAAAGVAGAVGTIALALAFELGDNEIWIAVLPTSLSAAVPILLSRGARAGICVRCGYDLRGLTIAAKGVCPECGHGLNAAA